MQINIMNFHFEADDEIKNYATEKIEGLERFDKEIVLADIHLESAPGDTANVRFLCKVNMEVPGGKVLYAEAKAQDMFAAVDMVEEKLIQQIKKQKQKGSKKKLMRAKEYLSNLFRKQ